MPIDTDNPDPLDNLADQFDAELDEALSSLDSEVQQTLGGTNLASDRPKDVQNPQPSSPASLEKEPVTQTGPARGSLMSLASRGQLEIPPDIRKSVAERAGSGGWATGYRRAKSSQDGLEVEYDKTINILLDHINEPTIARISFRNTLHKSYQNLVLKIHGGNSPYIGQWGETIGRLRPNDTWECKDIRLPLHNHALREVVEQVNDSLMVEITENGQIIYAKTLEVHIQPYNHWPMMVDRLWSLAAFITPNQQGVCDAVVKAAEHQQRVYGDTSFEGYQCLNDNTKPLEARADRLLEQISSLHDVCGKFGYGLDYINPPATFDSKEGVFGQKIRSPAEVLREGRGTCLDLSVLLVTLMESIGLHPLLVVLPDPGHVFVGVWLNEKISLNTRVRDATQDVRTKQCQYIDHLLLFDSTPMTRGENLGAAKGSALGWFGLILEQQNPFYLVDIMHCRKEGVLPLPHGLGGTNLASDRPKDVQNPQPSSPASLEKESAYQSMLARSSLISRVLNSQLETSPRIRKPIADRTGSGRWVAGCHKAKDGQDGLDIEYVKTINILLDHINEPTIARISFRNTLHKSYQNLVLKIHGGNSPYIGQWGETIGRLRPNDTWECKDIRLPLQNHALREVIEQVNDSLMVEITENGQIICAKTLEVHIQPYNYWPLIWDQLWTIAPFIMPNQQGVCDAVVKAADHQQRMYGNSAFEGYQCLSGKTQPSEAASARLLQQISSLYDVFGKDGYGLDYINPPATFDSKEGVIGQKIRSPAEVLREGRGTCLDLAVLLVSMMEHIGLHPLMVLTPIPGHAFVGVWTNETCSLNSRVKDATQDVRTKQYQYMDHLLLFDPTAITHGANFDDAVNKHALVSLKVALEQQNPFYLVDIQHCRKEGVLPLPHG